ncbi:MAG: 50S ribosomal protein L21 [Coprothermobacterota bacterium]|jgi:large subunit ribosomal protein L21|nr:50S ribosomal protein L21 [Coprothermobacterota bacterium]
MYAVVQIGGKQHKVQPDATFRVDCLTGEVGQTLELNKIAMIVDRDKVLVGKPFVEGAILRVTVLEQGRDRKIQVYTYKAKTNFHRMAGHRQDVTTLLVEGITYPGQEGES